MSDQEHYPADFDSFAEHHRATEEALAEKDAELLALRAFLRELAKWPEYDQLVRQSGQVETAALVGFPVEPRP